MRGRVSKPGGSTGVAGVRASGQGLRGAEGRRWHLLMSLHHYESEGTESDRRIAFFKIATTRACGMFEAFLGRSEKTVE
jgi:hypothetical protein